MRHPLQLIIGLLACLALASALPGLFPRNYVTIYKYYADLKTGTIEPKAYASQFAITGSMQVAREVRNATLKNAYSVVLNISHAMRNGEIQHFDQIVGSTAPIPDAAKALQNPFVIIFNENGKVESLMTYEDEPGWSENIKRSIASMLQLDLSSMHLEIPMKPHSFLNKENTIYGECAVAYDVHRTLELDEKHFTVTKMIEPMTCENFKQHTFNARESQDCMIEDEEEMTTASRRVYHIENTGEDLLIESLEADGTINYFPWKANSEAHYILANQTMKLESMVPVESTTLPELNMEKMKLLNDITFQQSETLHAVHADVDHTYGRRVVNLEALVSGLIRLLEKAADYMDESHLEMTSPDLEHGQTMNRILDTMSRMDIPSLEQVFNNIMEGTSPKELTIQTLFLKMIPYVGTNATCLFTRNIIRKQKISDRIAIFMLTNLPYNLRRPTDSLLIEMEDLINFRNDTSIDVRKAGLLCFASMIYKTHRHDSYLRRMDPKLVNKYVKYYFDHVMSEPTYEMKMAFLHGMRNIDMGDAHKLLEPIIRGELKLSEKPDHLRLNAMLMNFGTDRDTDDIYKLYWTILANRELPLILRLCAYAILIGQPPRMDRLMSLHWLMVYEKNEHLYNYHYTAMKSLANVVNPCMTPMREMARKLMRFTRARPASGIMSGVRILDFENRKFGFGDSLTIFTAADENTGVPIASFIDYTVISRRRPVKDMGIWIRMECDDIYKNIFFNPTMEKPDIQIKEMEDVLLKAAKDMPPQKPFHIEWAILKQGRTLFTQYWDEMPTMSAIKAMFDLATDMKFNMHAVMFDELFTMQVPTDMGLPALLHNNIPRVMSMTSTYEGTTDEASSWLGIKLSTVFQDWRHGYYSMEVYNPMADCWHAIRRVSAFDASFPITVNIAFNTADKNLKLNMPRLPLTNRSIAGVRSYAENYVMVMGPDDGATLERYCGTCNPTVPVTRGARHRKNTTYLNYDSKDTGLLLSSHEYNCEGSARPNSRCKETDEIENTDRNTGNNDGVLLAMTLREQYLLRLINPEVGTCGFLVRMEPSMTYPTSEIDITLRSSVQVAIEENLSLFPTTRFHLRGTLDAKALTTNLSAQSWSMNAVMSLSHGFLDQGQVKVTRKTPGEKDLMICVDGSTVYSRPEVDPLIRNSTKPQDILGKLIITMGESDDGTCAQDNVSIKISTKAEMTDEQREAVEHETLHGMCQKDIENPKYMYNESSIVPRTPACLQEAILRSSMRKYTYTVAYENVSRSVLPAVYWWADELRKSLSNCVQYLPAHTEPGMIKIFLEYPLDDENMDVIVRTPDGEEDYIGIDRIYYEREFGFYLENIRFSREFLEAVEEKTIRFCGLYPEILLNADGAHMPYICPSEWTLLTGDYKYHMFSVFAKRFESQKLGLLMSVGNHTVEVTPSATTPTVTVDGKVIDHVKGTVIQGDSDDVLRIIWNHNRLIIKSMYTSFDVEWNERFVGLAMRTNLQGQVTGLCGHLDGTHAERMAKAYSFGS